MTRHGLSLLLACSAICLTGVLGAFEGYQFLSVTPATKDHVLYLRQLADDFVDVDFWQEPSPNSTVHVVVPPGLVSIVTESLTKYGIKWEMGQADLAGMVEASMTKTIPQHHRRFRVAEDVIDHYNYHDYGKIVAYLNELQTKYPENIELSYLSYFTHEGRQVIYAKLQGVAGTNKPSIIGESGIHAREWATPASTLYVIEKLLQNYQNGDETARSMLDKYDWYFIPVTNPDGYDFTHAHSSNRLWRKNRRYVSSRCIGVDLNRNFDVQFGTTGVSKRCDSDIYPGSHGFSEPETANIRELVQQLGPTLVSYLSIHSYSQLLLVPWGYTESYSRPDTHVELDRVANLMAAAIKSTDGQTYQVGTAYQLLNYAASGASEDWALSVMPSLYAYCYELRPNWDDPRGFLLPPNEIVPTGRELYASLAVLAEQIKL